MTPSSMPAFAMPRGLVTATDVHRLVVEDEAQGVGIMHGDVEDDAAAGLGLGEAPALKMRRQMDRMEHACGERVGRSARP